MQTYLEKQQPLSVLLEQARLNGEVQIQGEDGQKFVLSVLKSEPVKQSPLNVEGLDLGISTDEIVDFIHESRK